MNYLAAEGAAGLPAVYSVGLDGVDQGGSRKAVKELRFPPGAWEAVDEVAGLARVPRTPEEEELGEDVK